MDTTNEIILYQHDETMKLEVRPKDENLFGTKCSAILKHLSHILTIV